MAIPAATATASGRTGTAGSSSASVPALRLPSFAALAGTQTGPAPAAAVVGPHGWGSPAAGHSGKDNGETHQEGYHKHIDKHDDKHRLGAHE